MSHLPRVTGGGRRRVPRLRRHHGGPRHADDHQHDQLVPLQVMHHWANGSTGLMAATERRREREGGRGGEWCENWMRQAVEGVLCRIWLMASSGPAGSD